MKSSWLLFFCLMMMARVASSQKHLVLMKNGVTIAQYSEGEYIRIKLKNGKRSEGHILELKPFSMITSGDTIQFQDIHKIDIRKHRKFNVSSGIGGLLFLGGILYISIDRLNAGYSTPKDLDPSVWHTSAIMTGVGAALIFIKPRYIRVNYKVTIRTVDYNSNLYHN